jgi:iron complex transport system substrate-binding protein
VSLFSLRPARAVALAAASLLVLAGCGSSGEAAESTSGTADSSSSFKEVTIKHAFGSTTIEEQPERVATWGWGSADAAIALGVTPVAIPTQSYGGDAKGVLPWIKEELQAKKEEVPTLLSETEEPPYEEIAAAKPDVILATYSGLTKEQYDLLSEIAPVVAYPDQPWSTPWREVITTAGKALGKTGEAREVLQDIDSEVAAAAKEHPELAGKSVAAVADSAGTFYVYKRTDPRMEFTLDLGLESAPSVEQLENGGSTFFYTLSYEQLDKLTSDILVVYAPTQKEADRFMSSKPAKAMEQVQRGSVAQVVGEDLVASVSPPTALSLTWGLDEYVDLLSEASKKA